MKTDDDAFVRVDEVLSVLRKKNIRTGLLYGLISFDSAPIRDSNSKWYISAEVLLQKFFLPTSIRCFSLENPQTTALSSTLSRSGAMPRTHHGLMGLDISSLEMLPSLSSRVTMKGCSRCGIQFKYFLFLSNLYSN